MGLIIASTQWERGEVCDKLHIELRVTSPTAFPFHATPENGETVEAWVVDKLVPLMKEEDIRHLITAASARRLSL